MEKRTHSKHDRFREKTLASELKKKWTELSDTAIIPPSGHHRQTTVILAFDMNGYTFYRYCDVFELEDFQTDSAMTAEIETDLNIFRRTLEGRTENAKFLIDMYAAKYMFDTKDEREKTIVPIVERVKRITRNLNGEHKEKLKAVCGAKTPLLTEEELKMTNETAILPHANPNLRNKRLPWDL